MNLITNQLRKQSAQQFIDRIQAGSDVYYMFIGRINPFVDDNAPPTPVDNTQTVNIDVFEQMIAGKRVTPGDVQMLVTRYDWVSNTVYQPYAHDEDLSQSQYYVLVNKGVNHSVFKCIDNNNGTPSTVAPDSNSTSPEDDVYETSDGYRWKFMYTIPDATYRKFTTSQFMPVVVNANVVSNAVSGAIYNVEVEYQGSGYNSYGAGVIQIAAVNGDARVFQVEATKSANTDFFKNSAFKITSGTGAGQQRLISEYVVSGSSRNVVVDTPFAILPDIFSRYEISPLVVLTGDGQDFVGRGLVNASSSNSIYRIEITDPGINFTYANAIVLANTGGTTNTAILKPIISPQGGHGFDAVSELGARHMGVSVTFNSGDGDNNDKLLDVNDYRTIGLIKDPMFANVVIDFTAATSSFAVGDTITQSSTGASGTIVDVDVGTIKLTNVLRFFVAGNSTVNTIVSNQGTIAAVDSVAGPTTYIDQTHKLIIDNAAGSFQQDERIAQGTNASGIMYTANSTQMRITNKRGIFNKSDDIVGIVETVSGTSSGSSAKITDAVAGDLVPQKGSVVYLENVTPITRYERQSETLKLILKF
jgi:hypothetical protein